MGKAGASALGGCARAAGKLGWGARGCAALLAAWCGLQAALALWHAPGDRAPAPGAAPRGEEAPARPTTGRPGGRGASDGGALARDGQGQVRRRGARAAADPCGIERDPPGLAAEWPPPRPAIFTNLTASWRARREWTDRGAFVRDVGSWTHALSTFERDEWLRLVGPSGDFVAEPFDVTLDGYLEALGRMRRNVFLFERDDGLGPGGLRSARRDRRRRFFEALAAGYRAPPGFTEALRIFAADGAASGHGMHRHKEAWLAQLAGRKVWWVAPPASWPERINEFGHPVFPYTNLSHEEGSWPCAWLVREHLVPAGAPIRRCVQLPGELLVLPARWWHMTCSLDDFNLAVGGQGA